MITSEEELSHFESVQALRETLTLLKDVVLKNMRKAIENFSSSTIVNQLKK